MACNIRLFIFYMVCIFSNVMTLQFCKKYLSHSMVLILLSFLCNHGKSIRKLH